MKLLTCLAVATTLLVCVPTSLLAQPPESPAAATAAKETWFGILDAGNRRFRFVLELEKKSEQWTGQLLSLDEGVSRFPLDHLSFQDGQMSFEIRVSAGAFSGKLSDDGQMLRGRWKQREADLELQFRKVDSVPKEQLKALWVGELNVVVQTLEVAFRELEDGSVLFDSISQKAGGFVANKSEVDGEVVFEVPAVKGKFTGKSNADKTEIVGKWTQGLIPLNLTLKKSEASALEVREPLRPQTPKAPFPYQTQEVVIDNPKAPGVQLAASLTLPDGTDTVPAVVLISGSGPQDRDESIAGHKPFWVLADHLSRQGIAVLRFDDRGFGKSQGDFASATTEDFASDVLALFNYLIQHPRIDPARVGLCGHSEGGLIAPLVAAEDKRVAFLVLMAGPGVNGDQILSSQVRLILEASGVAESEIQRQLRMQRIFLDLAQQEPLLSKEEFVAAAMRNIASELSEDEQNTPDLQQHVKAAATQLLTPWFRFFLKYEPAGALSRLRCPVLAINGSKDLQVDPELNIPAITAAFADSAPKYLETQVFPDLNHLFQRCKTGNLNEYELLEETLHPSVLNKISSWILERNSLK